MPLVTTGATVPGLYSHIAHSVDKDEEEIPPLFKGAKPKQTRGRGKPKRKPQGHRQNPLKDQEADETYTYDNPNNYYHNDNYTAPGQNQGLRPFNGQGGSRQFRGFTQRSRGQRPQYNQCQFQNYRFLRGSYQSSRSQFSCQHKPYFQGNQPNLYGEQSCGWGSQQIRGHGCGRANYQGNNNNNYQYQYYTHDQQTEQYGPPCSLCSGFNHSLSNATKENMI